MYSRFPARLQEGKGYFEWKAHSVEDPCYAVIGERLVMRNGLLNDERWGELNEICITEPVVPSLQTTPETPFVEDPSEVIPTVNWDPMSYGY